MNVCISVSKTSFRYCNVIITFQTEELYDFIHIAWISSAAFFGITIADTSAVNRQSGKIALFAIFIAGSCLFNVYQGVLTAHLVVSKETVPFSSPQEFMKTSEYEQVT